MDYNYTYYFAVGEVDHSMDDCWEDDENYDEDNPPVLWRMCIYDYGYYLEVLN